MRFVSAAMAALIMSTPAWAEDRGVVIDNADYRHWADVEGADASAASDALKEQGFRTVRGSNLNAADIRKALADLARSDENPGVRMVVLNGRFAHSATETWLLGTDARDTTLVDAGVEGMPLSSVMELMRRAAPGAVLLLGSDQGEMALGAGLEPGLGSFTPPEGVTILSGPASVTAQVAQDLLIAGTSIDEALKQRPAMGINGKGDGSLILMSGKASDGLKSDRDAWVAAAEANTEAGYRAYLKDFPKGIYSAAAEERLRRLTGGPAASPDAERDAWADAAAKDNRTVYNDFLRRYPDSRYADAARRRLAELTPATSTPRPSDPAANPAGQEKPIISTETAAQRAERDLGFGREERLSVQRQLTRLGYPSGTPDGVFGGRSRKAIGNWQSENGFQRTGYLSREQVQHLRAQVQRHDAQQASRDDEYWGQTGANGGERNLRAYLERYPSGRHAAEARRALGQDQPERPQEGDDATWNWARNQNTAGAYTAYLDRFPRGRHADEARQRRDNLGAGIQAARRAEAALGLNPSTRRLVEERLQAAGMRPGKVDGQFTQDTREALRRYQVSRNLRVSGYVTQETVSSLLADALLR